MFCSYQQSCINVTHHAKAINALRSVPWYRDALRHDYAVRPILTGFDITNQPTPNWQTKPSQAKPSQAKPSQAKPSQAKPSQAKPSQAKPSQTKPIQTKPNQAKPNQTNQCCITLELLCQRALPYPLRQSYIVLVRTGN
jgi:cell division septation protein DedD